VWGVLVPTSSFVVKSFFGASSIVVKSNNSICRQASPEARSGAREETVLVARVELGVNTYERSGV